MKAWVLPRIWTNPEASGLKTQNNESETTKARGLPHIWTKPEALEKHLRKIPLKNTFENYL
jgi:hypothetical protein